MKIRLLTCALALVATIAAPAPAQATGVEDTVNQVVCTLPQPPPPPSGGYPWRCDP